MSKKDDVLKTIVKAGSEGVARSELSKNLKLTDSAIYTHVYRLNKTGNKITHEGDRYFCVSVSTDPIASPSESETESAPEEAIIQDEVPTIPIRYLYEKVASAIVNSGNVGMNAVELAETLETTASRIFGFIHTLREKGYKIKLNGDRYVMVGIPGHAGKKNKESVQPVAVSPVGVESLSKVADKLINSGKVHKNLLSLGIPVGSGGNLTSQQQEYLDMVQKSMFYALCAEALVQSAQHTHNIQKEVSGEE